MKKEQAHQRLTEKFQAGLISIEEVKAWRRQIEAIDASDNDQKQKEARYKIWAN